MPLQRRGARRQWLAPDKMNETLQGRTHGRTDQLSYVKKVLASTHEVAARQNRLTQAIDLACVKTKNLEGRENDISQVNQNRTGLRIFASLTVI